MKQILIVMAIAMFLISSSAHAFSGKSKSYDIISDFGITEPSKLVVFPKAFQYKTKDAFFYVPFSSIDYTLLEHATLKISVRGKLITLKMKSKIYAESLNRDLTRAISGEYQ